MDGNEQNKYIFPARKAENIEEFYKAPNDNDFSLRIY